MAAGAEFVGHLVARVHDDALDRAGRQGARADVLETLGGVGVLADVDEDAHDLDVPLLDHPSHGHRRVETSAVCQNDALHHFLPFFVLEMSSSPAKLRNSLTSDGSAATLVGDHQDRVVTRDRTQHAVERAAVEGRGHHVRAARRRANHHQVARTVDRSDPLAHHPTQVVHRRRRDGRCRGDDDSSRAVQVAHLDGAQVLEVARHGRLRGDDALGLESGHQLRRGRDHLPFEEVADPVLSLRLGHFSSFIQRRTPRIAERR